MDPVVLCGGDVGQQEKTPDLKHVEQEVNVTSPERASSALVEVEVHKGAEQAGGRVEANAKPPDVPLWGHSTYGRTDGRQVIRNLEED